MANNVPLLILGMHRSGTSMCTQWLHKAGLFVGEQLAGKAIGNIKGLYEDREYVELHKAILEYQGPGAKNLLTTPDHIELPAQLKNKMQKITIQKQASSPAPWGWKDPLTCLFVPFYRELIPDFTSIVLFRHYGNVVDSLIRRAWSAKRHKYQQKGRFGRLIFPLKTTLQYQHYRKQRISGFLNTWIRYNEMLLADIEQYPNARRIVLSVDSLIRYFEPVQATLTQWGHITHPIQQSELYDSTLMQRECVELEADKTQLARAEALYQRLLAAQSITPHSTLTKSAKHRTTPTQAHFLKLGTTAGTR